MALSNITKIVLAAVVVTATLVGCERRMDARNSAANNQPTNPPAVNPAAANPGPPTVGTVIDDGVITTRVKSALLADPDVKSFDISVETRKGEVLLSGFVDNQAQIDRAISITQRVEGVRNVDNKMSLKK